VLVFQYKSNNLQVKTTFSKSFSFDFKWKNYKYNKYYRKIL